MCVSQVTDDCSLGENAYPCITLLYIVYNLLLCVCITGVQTKLPTTGAETRPAEPSVRGLISSSQRPPPSPPTDWSQPEIEDDDQCVTLIFCCKPLSLMEDVVTVLQKWMSECEDLNELTRVLFL